MDAAANAVSKLLSGAGEKFSHKSEQVNTEQVKTEEVKTTQAKTEPEVAPVVDSAATGEKDTTVDQTI
ncbi:hypothetical protein KCU84_g12860, partial [Aureobasidium melanogenum]